VASGQIEVFRKYGLTHVCVFAQSFDVVSCERGGRRSRIRELTQRDLPEIGLVQGIVFTHFIGNLKDFEPQPGWRRNLRCHVAPRSGFQRQDRSRYALDL
jgi:hypothetical protein